MALTQDATAILIRLGFTQLEADIYTFLLINGATTGYGVGKGVSKPVANVYKAIDSLLMKGAIEQTSGDKKKCIAIPWQQLIKNQQRQFDADIDVLKQAFNNFPKPSSDEAVYQIKNIEQLKDSSVELINSATKILLADVEPQLIEPLSVVSRLS